MSEVLSQKEIDNLLKELSEGNIQENAKDEEVHTRIKKYDFRIANKFSKEQIKTLYTINVNFSQIFSSYLSGTLRTNCQVDMLSTEEQTFAEYTNSLPSPLILAIIDIPPLEGQILIQIPPNITYGIIDRLLGGKGGDLEVTKAFSDIDVALISKVIHQMCKHIESAWERVIPVKATLSRVETSPQFAQIVSYNEPIAISTIRVQIADDLEGFINICIPYVAVEAVADKMETSAWASSKKIVVNKDNEKIIRKKLANTAIKISAQFKDTTITLGDCLNLEPGDVLKLNHRTTDEVIVKMADIPKFRGKLGVYDHNVAVRITNVLKEEM